MNDEKLTRIVEAVTRQFTEAKGEEKPFGLKQARKLIAMVEAKAKTMGLNIVAAVSNEAGPLYGIQHTSGGQIVIFGGGDPLIYHGKIVGGLGVSGGSEEQDTALSAYGASILDDIMNEN